MIFLKTTRFFLIVVTALALAAIILTLPSRSNIAATSQQQESSNQKQDTQDEMPIAVFSVPEPVDSTEQVLRKARNSRYDSSYTTRFDQVRSDTVEISRISHFWINMPAFPTAQSNAVVLGEVIDSHGYVSNDKTGAYSEFTIRIEKALKDDGRLSSGVLIAEREGADVKLPDGRILRYRIADQGMPRVGSRYVLFLKYETQGNDYHILTGYRLYNGRVFPLDDSIGRFAAYKDSDEIIFMSAVEAAIANPPPSPQDMRRVNQ